MQRGISNEVRFEKNMFFKYVVARFQLRIATKHDNTIKFASTRKSGTTKKQEKTYSQCLVCEYDLLKRMVVRHKTLAWACEMFGWVSSASLLLSQNDPVILRILGFQVAFKV